MAGHLPLEILDHILSLIKGPIPTWDHSVRIRRQEQENPNLTLLSASLVNKTWASAAQRALYRHAIFTAKPGPDTYTSWIESAARKRHRTVSLWIRPWYDRIFQEVLNSCEGLEHLALGSVFSLTRYVGYPPWEMLCTPSLKDLKSLSIPNSSTFDCANPCTFPFDLSSLFLLLPADSIRLPRMSLALLASSDSTLKSLRMGIMGSPYDPFPADLFPAPLSEVRHLIVEEEHAAESPDRDEDDEDEDEDFITSLAHSFSSSTFPSLETLELRGLNLYPKIRRKPGFFSSTIKSLPLPATLLRLVVAIGDPENMDEVLDTLEDDEEALTRLEVLEFPFLRAIDAAGAGEGPLDDLQGWCRKRGVTLVWEDGEDDLEEWDGGVGRWESESEESGGESGSPGSGSEEV